MYFLFVFEAGGDHPIHPAGRYEYPVQMQLPLQLPSSFEGAWGRVRYCLQGTIDKPWKFDHHCKRAFTVLSILDLNTQANVLVSKCVRPHVFDNVVY